ncbi:MAG: lipase family protein [Myxococcota bacterium]
MRSSFLIVLVHVLVGCGGDPEPAPPPVEPQAVRGQPIDLEPLAEFDVGFVREALDEAGLGELAPVETGVSLARLSYTTVDEYGAPTWASGLLAMPLDLSPRALISYQHGTITDRADAPSMGEGDESLLVAALFAGHGFAYLAPDYLGLGTGPGLHPYMHAASEATATLDLIRAAGSPELEGSGLALDLSMPSLLVGFSQGAHASLAALRASDSESERALGNLPDVTAVAAIAGPHALSDVQIPHSLDATTGGGPVYLGYLISAYQRIYDGPALSEAVRAPYASRLPELFDGSQGETVAEELPTTGAELVIPELATALRNGGDNWLARALADNDLLGWIPNRPVVLYVGRADVDVPAENSERAVEVWRARGASVELVELGPVDHSASAALGLVAARARFDTMLRERG